MRRRRGRRPRAGAEEGGQGPEGDAGVEGGWLGLAAGTVHRRPEWGGRGCQGWVWRVRSGDFISCALQSSRFRKCCCALPVRGRERIPSCQGAAAKELIIFLCGNGSPFHLLLAQHILQV